jgi:hypothetical protein
MKRSEVYQGAIDNNMTPAHKAAGITMVDNLNTTKQVYLKFQSKQHLTDEEVVYGIKAFFELSTDLAECVGQSTSAIEALDISLALRFIAKERNICLTN